MTFTLCQYTSLLFRDHLTLPQLNFSNDCCKCLTSLQLEGPAHFGVLLLHYTVTLQKSEIQTEMKKGV